jgi:Copper type II ascorbate-dependent monooxygenase, C-terminal domain/Copper type II ascorbate-dependent monooxygenase, N-terminal domain
MRRPLVALALGALVTSLIAATTGSARETHAPTYYQHVKPILDARCASCHMTGGIAPFSLRTYSQARRQREAMAAAVRSRVMPPWHADPGYRAYLGNPSLSRAQISAIARWAAQGAPRGNPAAPGRPLPPIRGGLTREDLRLPLPTYTPRRSGSTDDYHCFVLAWSQAARYVTGVDIAPGERREVHHIIVYTASPEDAATVDAWDARERGPGYRCYGGPAATGAQQIRASFLAGWAPGGAGTDLPAGTGTLVEQGSRLIVQIHYNLESTTPRPDRTTVVLKLDDVVQKRGGFAPVVDLGWLISPQSFRVPAGKRRVTHTFSGDPRLALDVIGTKLDLRNGFVVHSALLHMHRLGKRGQIALVRRSGRREVLLSISRWDFNWQRDYRFAAPVRFENGDRIAIRCEHDNSRANQPLRNGRRATPRTVTWGEDSSDEMCIGFVYVSEP